MTIKTIGLDLAKLVFQIHGVDEHSHVVLLPQTFLNVRFPNSPSAALGREHVFTVRKSCRSRPAPAERRLTGIQPPDSGLLLKVG